MCKRIVFILAALMLCSFPVGAANWTFKDNVLIQGNLTVSGTTNVGAGTFQAYDPDLAVLAYPTPWRLFYSNGARVITELALDNTVGQCLKSGGSSTAPTWGTCGTGSGNINNTTMDNTIVGGTTPAAGYFTSITRGAVSNTEFGYLDGVNAPIQTQLAGKQALDNGTFTGTVRGSQFVSDCVPANNTCGVGDMNDGDPTGGNLSAGLTWFKGSTNVRQQRSSDNTATYEILSSKVAKFSKCTTIDNALSTSDYPIEKFPQAITITNVKVYQIGATNVIGGLDECTGTNGVCTSTTAVDADITGTNGAEVADDGSLSNPSIASGNWIRWHTTSVSGTNTSLSVCFFYTMDSAK